MKNKITLIYYLVLVSIFLFSCEIVTIFPDTQNAILYSRPTPILYSAKNTISIMTWNIRFGARRMKWFGDCCGDRVILSKNEIANGLRDVAEKIREINPDILILQEVDKNSKRTGYIDQVQFLLENTGMNYGAYGSMWQAQIVPSDGIGRIDVGNAILSKFPISEVVRIQLPLISNQDALTRFFYLRRNMLRAKIHIANHKDFVLINVHSDAFSTDGTKQKHINLFKQEIDNAVSNGFDVIAGGDLNTLPPQTSITDFCIKDKCNGDSHVHGVEDNENPNVSNDKIKEGSHYTPEKTWLNNLYLNYKSAISLEKYLANQSRYFTHSVGADTTLDRALDYLFTNTNWIAGSDTVRQDAKHISDHLPVVAKWKVAK